MPVRVDYVLEDASGVGKAMDNHIEIIKTRGNGQKKRDSLAEGIANVTKLNSDQMRAQNFLDNKTSEQNDLMQQATKVITGIHNAAKSAAKDPDNRINLKVFKVGVDTPQSVKGMTSMLDYFSGVVAEHHDVLVANGMTEEDIASVPALYASLIGGNAAQENAKKLRNGATERRDDAAKALQQTITGIREYAKNVFKDDPAILEEFKPIPKGRGKGKNKPPNSSGGDKPTGS
jgi:hypothetical protein